MGGVRWGCKALGDELAKSSPQFAPALARGLATLGKRQELVNLAKSVSRAVVKSRQTSAVSMMPSGLTAHLREGEFVDLLAYLASLGKTAEKKSGRFR